MRIIFYLVVFSIASNIYGQSRDGEIAIKIINIDNKKPIHGAKIELNDGTIASTETDGKALITNLIVNRRYKITITKKGFQTINQSENAIKQSQDIIVIELEPIVYFPIYGSTLDTSRTPLNGVKVISHIPPNIIDRSDSTNKDGVFKIMLERENLFKDSKDKEGSFLFLKKDYKQSRREVSFTDKQTHINFKEVVLQPIKKINPNTGLESVIPSNKVIIKGTIINKKNKSYLGGATVIIKVKGKEPIRKQTNEFGQFQFIFLKKDIINSKFDLIVTKSGYKSYRKKKFIVNTNGVSVSDLEYIELEKLQQIILDNQPENSPNKRVYYIVGTVINKDSIPLPNTTVYLKSEVHNQFTTTDEYGDFQFIIKIDNSLSNNIYELNYKRLGYSNKTTDSLFTLPNLADNHGLIILEKVYTPLKPINLNPKNIISQTPFYIKSGLVATTVSGVAGIIRGSGLKTAQREKYNRIYIQKTNPSNEAYSSYAFNESRSQRGHYYDEINKEFRKGDRLVKIGVGLVVASVATATYLTLKKPNKKRNSLGLSPLIQLNDNYSSLFNSQNQLGISLKYSF